ncbi:pyridoxamine 5'-phosphate oxidase family protein [Skermanella rosea]|uniref:2Fe-2S iron-sulfur cluster-binding protein n=1 Tax=Skermanella rosea TaxID=1817965 RepID=UPI001931FC19|nr:pyridoxamine 5'-phosphate oxidase family protein [Skermanella rosea]UEM01784.1 pyridoxamine 5'-phosphate oxidase family protein [Skermanella rosea]
MSVDPASASSPFHPGEIRLQRLLGVAERVAPQGRAIRDHMPDQHRDFFRQLPFVVLGSVDPAGDGWVTLLAGHPGFMGSPDPRTLSVTAPRDGRDPALAHLKDGDAIGLLGIEPHTRRRNRLNGRIFGSRPGGFDVRVEQSFGNCPQYIQKRDNAFVRDPGDTDALPDAVVTEGLDDRARRHIAAADSFFVSSHMDDAAGRHVDASHRGGKAGFVRVNGDGSLTIPDFAGNLQFNTLGNFVLNPRAGLVFPDFETGDLLHLTGDAEVILESEEIAAFQGAERLWTFRPRKVVFRPGALALRGAMLPDGWSPNSLMTGDWEEARSRLAAAALGSRWRPFRIAKLIDESDVIRSFHLEPADGNGIIPHLAGQHLPIRVLPDGHAEPVTRTYTLSTAPSDGNYRISVKREGLVSRHLHDRLSVGDIIEARAPAGGFTIDAAERRPAVLLAAGIGITPLLAMARHLVHEGLRTRRIRPTWLFVSARTLAERAFDSEIAELVERSDGAVRLIRVLGDPTGAVERRDYDVAGRITLELLRAVLPLDGYDFLMCGPPAFMRDLYDGLRAIGTPDDRIHAEAFGPASLARTGVGPAVQPMAPSKEAVPVVFARSGKEALWEPGTGALLDLAESVGLTPDFSCRSGSCGTCATRILSGKVTYEHPIQAKVTEDVALICSGVPADRSAGGGDKLTLDL